MISAIQALQILLDGKIISQCNVKGIEKIANGKELLVVRRITNDQNINIQTTLKCDLFDSISTGDTIECNNYFYTNFRLGV
jgi:hypothetical protein